MDRLALFDLDNTLLDGDSDVEWSELLAREGAMDAARTRAFHRDYEDGCLDIHAFLRFQLEPLAREPLERLHAWRDEFLDEWIRPRLSIAARDLVRAHLDAGHATALVTATNRFLVEPIARELGLAHVIATEPEVRDGLFTGAVRGIPCYREGKITCVDAWLAARGLRFEDVRETWFYSDSHNDLPLLSRVTHPVCANPDARLRAHAALHGWPTIDLRVTDDERVRSRRPAS